VSIEHLAWGLKVPELSASARMVLLVLADAANASGYAEVTSDLLQSRSCQSHEIVTRRLRELADAGLISQVGNGWRVVLPDAPRPSIVETAEERRLRDARIMTEMEERRASRREHSAEERERVRALADQTMRQLGTPRLPYADE